MRFSYEKISRRSGVPVQTSHGVFPTRESLIVRIDGPDGNFACGECAPWKGFGCETLERGETFLRACRGNIPAEIPENLPCVAHAFSAAKFFLETPEKSNLPVAENKLCAKFICRVPGDLPEKILAEIERGRKSGFSVFKIKIGFDEVDRELRFCEKILEKIPAGTRIRFDANGAFSPDVLPALINLSTAPAMDFFEQPLPASPENDAEIFVAAENAGGKFALDESVRAPWAFPSGTPVIAVVKPLLIADFPRLLSWLSDSNGPQTVISTVFENSPAGAQALRLACAALAVSRRCAFGLGF